MSQHHLDCRDYILRPLKLWSRRIQSLRICEIIQWNISEAISLVNHKKTWLLYKSYFWPKDMSKINWELISRLWTQAYLDTGNTNSTSVRKWMRANIFWRIDSFSLSHIPYHVKWIFDVAFLGINYTYFSYVRGIKTTIRIVINFVLKFLMYKSNIVDLYIKIVSICFHSLAPLLIYFIFNLFLSISL